MHGQPVVDFAPAQGNAPLSMLTDVNAEALAFPNLFPLGCGHFNDSSRHYSNNIKMGIAKNLFKSPYAKMRLLNSNTKWAENPEYIFFLQNYIERERINSLASIHMKKNRKTSVA